MTNKCSEAAAQMLVPRPKLMTTPADAWNQPKFGKKALGSVSHAVQDAGSMSML